jgi:DNA repair exonuclease SbcCD ATPase subunit
MKEVRERCESLEEELADAHRLLSERSREGETMRRLLNESDSRAETRIKEMRARMDIAIEERDRAEETASTLTRRRARELDDLKSKVRDAERALTRAVEEKEELSRAESELRRQKEDIEKRIRNDEDEVKEVRNAMSQLREALDDTENSRKQLESERADLKKALEDTTARLEKLQKSSKEMSDQLKAAKVRTAIDPSIHSSTRSSVESTRSPSRIGSPIPPGSLGKGRIGSLAGEAGVDYVYLKNVLLQFLEQRDKKHQMQLIPVLGMLLHFDKKDEQRWQSVVGAR